MSEKKDGGPAYPGWLDGLENKSRVSYRRGMSLRDYFAAQAICGILSSGEYSLKVLVKNGVQDEPKLAYRIADAMLKERED